MNFGQPIQLPKTYRPNSAKQQSFTASGKQYMHVQNLQLTVNQQKEEPQQKSPPQNKKLKLAQTGTFKSSNEQTGENLFDQFMQQKIDNSSNLKRIYQDGEQNKAIVNNQSSSSSKKVGSKPFKISKQQLQKQKQKEEESKLHKSVATEFTMNSNDSKKPFMKFYQNIRSVDTQIPKPKQQFDRSEDQIEPKKVQQQLQNPSFASTDKSYEISQREEDNDTLSVISQGQVSQSDSKQQSQFKQKSSSQVKQQNFKQYVNMKNKQQQSKIDDLNSASQFQQQQQQQQQPSLQFQGWTVNRPNQNRPSSAQYITILENMERIIENSTINRGMYLKELNGYIDKVSGQQLQKKERKEKNSTKRNNQQLEKVERKDSNIEQEQNVDDRDSDIKQLEKEIRKLAKKLRFKESESFNSQASQTANLLHSIAEEPLDNLSKMTAQDLRNRSMFITDLLKNRSILEKHLTNQEQDPSESLNSSYVSDSSQADNQFQEKISKKPKLSGLTKEQQNRMDQLLQGMPASQICESNPYDMFKEPNNRTKWDDVHKKLKVYNKNYNEFESLELYNDTLPKDKVLREEALQRIIKTKTVQITQQLMENVTKESGGNLEDKFKIQDLISNLQKASRLKPDDVKAKFPLLQEQEQYRKQQFEELEDYQQEAYRILSAFNPGQSLAEIQQLKAQIDLAIKANLQLQIEVQSDPRYQLAKVISEKKQQLEIIELENADLNQRAEGIFRLEEFVNTLLKDATENQNQIQQGQIIEQQQMEQQPEKTIEDYDREISMKLNIDMEQCYQHNEIITQEMLEDKV